MQVVKRNGDIIEFDLRRIESAIIKAFLSLGTVQDIDVIENLLPTIEVKIKSLEEENINVESIQDIVEDVLLDAGHREVAKNYIRYREEKKLEREQGVEYRLRKKNLYIYDNTNQSVILFDSNIIKDKLVKLSNNLENVDVDLIVSGVRKKVYDRMPVSELKLVIINAVKDKIQEHYDYSKLAARIAKDYLISGIPNVENRDNVYQEKFSSYVDRGIKLDMLDARLKEFNLDFLANSLKPERDDLFFYLGVQTLIDRYFLRGRDKDKTVFELPQWFWMRVAMGLAINEKDKNEWAVKFYDVLSKMDFVSSTPTLFNSGTNHSQMSSCYLNTIQDTLSDIFKVVGSDNSQLSKWAGGIGTDFTNIRSTNSKIKSTNGESQGIIPFIKIFNDVALAVNQGGKRKGAMCAYLEVWHRDFEQFIELRKNTGDERRRAHDINTAAWIPDLFMKRVKNSGTWCLFSPSDVPDLHDLYGKAFEKKYTEYEASDVPKKVVQAKDLWKKMLTSLYETGHPWITFKDACNVRSPQDHVGVVHSSNLCTEITLNTSKDETAVCNLGSLNLSNMLSDSISVVFEDSNFLDREKVEKTLEIAIRMLDNVIDNNFYPIPEAKKANLRHRAIGLGVMGYQDCLLKLGIPFDSLENIKFADKSMEMVSYYAIKASSLLAKERGSYESYDGSKWSKGILPIDSLELLEEERGEQLKNLDKDSTLDWSFIRNLIKENGMRNSNVMAIAPTATISNISGVYPCIEPIFKNIYMKENLSGNFLVLNKYLVDDLKSRGLWSTNILNKIKLRDGSIQTIDEIPDEVKNLHKEVYEISPIWVVDTAAARLKWIDQAVSTNIFLKTTSGKVLNDLYFRAWEAGLKTTYYLRTLGASQVAKTVKEEVAIVESDLDVQTCSILNAGECEACQ